MNLSETNRAYNSVWISASAGTGKTRALARRVISLILQGTPIDKILCITFTKTASHEMKSRINSEISNLLALDYENFSNQLNAEYEININGSYEKLLEQLINFLDNPQKLKILTIHSFCKDLIDSFPFEIGIAPNPEIITGGEEKELITESLTKTVNWLFENDKSLLETISILFKESSLFDEISSALQHSLKIKQDFGSNKASFCIKDLKTEIDYLIEQFIDNLEIFLVPKIDHSNEKNYAFTYRFLNWQNLSKADKIKNYSQLVDLFLTKQYLPRKTLLDKKGRDAHLQFFTEMLDLQNKVLALEKNINLIKNKFYSQMMLVFLNKVFIEYQNLKQQRNYLEFNDLIRLSLDLLSKSQFSSWILYKLNYKFDHILIDEAQDTNHSQWSILNKICEEFFSGSAGYDNLRSIFVVGDEKQSIFGFQGSQPECFKYYKEFYQNQISGLEKQKFISLELNKSYRSSCKIIELINEVFSGETANLMSGNKEITHDIHRLDIQGKVELWPLVKSSNKSCEQNLAYLIASSINDWLRKDRLIASSNQVVRPSDIMIIIRKRGRLSEEIIKELSNFNIPNSGEDRFEIKQHLFIKDLIACASFAICPDDDLTCAALLRSPMVGIDDETLENLCLQRNGSLWESCDYPFLQELVIARHLSVKEFYSNIIAVNLDRYIPYYGISLKTIIAEFICLIDKFERDNISHLQLFVDWISNNDFEIKKDLDFGVDEVKIITAHGAKGLQSKIVILPDTTQPTTSKDRITALGDELHFSFNRKVQDDKISEQREHEKSDDFKEYLRLLYVSITRAENELYILGCNSGELLNDNCWYGIIQKSMSKICAKTSAQFNTDFIDNYKYIYGENLDRFWKNNDRPDDKNCNQQSTNSELQLRYVSFVAPSHSEQLVSYSPLSVSHKSFEIGSKIHKIIGIYPLFSGAIGQLKELMSNYYQNISDELDVTIVKSFYDKLFAGQISIEVGFINHTSHPTEKNVTIIYNGSIDMLYHLNAKTTIFEFKSNIMTPKSGNQIPEIYKTQLDHYRKIVTQCYVNQEISASFFWTRTGEITILA